MSKAPIISGENQGAWSWDLETLGFIGASAQECQDLLDKPWQGDSSTENTDAQLEWYECRLQVVREKAAALLRQTFDPRPNEAGEEHIDEDVAVELLGIEDHLGCEDGLNWDGSFTYVSVFVPASEAARIAFERRRIRGPESVEDPRLHSVVVRWDAELARLESYLRFLSESGFQFGVRLLTALC